MMSGRRVALLAVVLLGVDARSSFAEPRRAQLRYARGPGAERCPDDATLRAAVTARLGYDPFTAVADGDVTIITVAIARAGRGLRAVIDLEARGSPAGRRVLASPRPGCDDLAPTLELAISIAIDPLSLDRPAPPSLTPPATAT